MNNAGVAKLEDASALGADAARFAGSNPAPGTIYIKSLLRKISFSAPSAVKSLVDFAKLFIGQMSVNLSSGNVSMPQ